MSHSLGQQLRQVRTKRGLSLLDVAHKTRIPAARLHDLENDNYNTHGGLAYARSFLRTYAAYLEVDASPILDRLQPPPIAGAKDYRYLIQNLGPWVRARQFRSAAPPRKGSATRRGGSLVTVGLLTAGVALLGSSLMFANAMFNFPTATDPAAQQAGAEAKAPSTTHSKPLAVLPAISVDETSQVSWKAPSEPLVLPTKNISVTTSASDTVPVAIPVTADNMPVPGAPLKALPVD